MRHIALVILQFTDVCVDVPPITRESTLLVADDLHSFEVFKGEYSNYSHEAAVDLLIDKLNTNMEIFYAQKIF